MTRRASWGLDELRRDDKERLKTAFAQIDFVDVAGLVVTLGAGDDEIVIGGACYVGGTAHDGAKIAEVAFAVEADNQEAARVASCTSNSNWCHGSQIGRLSLAAIKATH